MPDPICPLFEELYLTEGLESSRKGQSLMVGGGPMFITVNGYAYQRFDFRVVHQQAKAKGLLPMNDADLDLAELAAQKNLENKDQKVKQNKQSDIDAKRRVEEAREADRLIRERDIGRFRNALDEADLRAFDAWRSAQDSTVLARRITMPESKNPTYVAFNKTEWNDRQLEEWFDVTRPRLLGIQEKWGKLDIKIATDVVLLEGIHEMGVEEGYYWSSNSSHTFGVAKSTDDQLQCFLRETLPEHHFISISFCLVLSRRRCRRMLICSKLPKWHEKTQK